MEKFLHPRFRRTVHFFQSNDPKCCGDNIHCKKSNIEDAFEVLSAQRKGLDDDEDEPGRAEELNAPDDGGGNVIEDTAVQRFE